MLLIFWFILYSTISGGFLKNFGADALMLAPEYMGRVDFVGTLITGLAMGVFIMSWHITTFILHSKRFKFLATTSQPFLKYCINNSLIPLAFLVVYIITMVQFNDDVELKPPGEILAMVGGLLFGIALIWGISFAYFFGAEKTIVRRMAPLVANPELFRKHFSDEHAWAEDMGRRVNFYLTSSLRLRKPRNVGHYRQDFIEKVFKRHHLAAIASIMLAFFFLVVVGFLLEYPLFELPAVASVLVFFAVMIAVIGALTYFLQSWSLPAAIILIIFINYLYKNEYIDPRNKAYGLNYSRKQPRAAYNQASLASMCTPLKIEEDQKEMLEVLNRWKERQRNEKPVLVFVNVSGGGLRSAAFVLNSLQQIDKTLDGRLMDNTFLISGASGGMLAATYYRELYRRKVNGGKINLYDPQYVDDISGDLLNPIFSSMIARDIFSPAQKFSVGSEKYVKDRGYAFENKLANNTRGFLNFQLKDMAEDERNAKIPLVVFNSVVKRDGRKMMISTLPLSFMMKPRNLHQVVSASPDAIDFANLFRHRNPMDLRALTALRMNATFPYVLPNVWLPTDPIIDVMDAGLRDNHGIETSLRFIENFESWIKENTSGVLILQIRDKLIGNWQHPFETNSLTDMLVNPATMLQHNWYKLQEFSQTDQYNYFKDSTGYKIHRINMVYIPEKEDKVAALNFHLSAREKRDIQQSFNHPINQQALEEISKILN
ncbi:MAG: hypothetical protein EOO01_08040 [Chitinophagaceae bacterium]|nr:MAG: hypothetical protein EOO01_08040 [Chitinophagaceae bacterium]